MVDKFLAAAPGMGLEVEVMVKDSQSNPNRAAEVASELISRDEVNLILVASTPETTNPVHNLRTRGNSGDFHRGAVAAVVHRPAGQPGRPGQLAALRLCLPLLLGAGGQRSPSSPTCGTQVETNKKVGGAVAE
jgi:hypothetical protein